MNKVNVDYDIKWEGKPSGLWHRFLTLLHLNFTDYQITENELIIKTGFFKQTIDSTELYLIKDPDVTRSLIQRIMGVGTVSMIVDSSSNSSKAGSKLYLNSIYDCEKVRKLIRDLSEQDTLNRKINYVNKV